MYLIKNILFLIYALSASPFTIAADYYVDAIDGTDTGEGDYQNPWRTLKKVGKQLSLLKPGDSINLKRGSTWKDQSLFIRNLNGAFGSPIVFRSYGDKKYSLPRLGPSNGILLIIENSSNIVVSDMVIKGTAKGPCVKLDHAASYISINNNIIGDCYSNGIRLAEKVHHVEISGNEIGRVDRNDGITIHEVNWGERRYAEAYAGSHHIIKNNKFLGPFHEDAIDVTSRGVEDVKIISNIIKNSGNAGINIAHGKNIWIYGNIISNTGNAGVAGAIKINRDSTGEIKLVGNLFKNNLMYSLIVYAGDINFHNNTVMQHTKRPLIRIEGQAARVSIARNVLENTGAGGWLISKTMPDKNNLLVDNNWYSGYADKVKKGCAFTYGNRKLAMLDRRVLYSSDFSSECSNIIKRGFNKKNGGVRFDSELENEKCPHFGALDCTMKLRDLTIDPLTNYKNNNGFGWMGFYE